MNKQIEICCGSYYDCLQAYHGGAKRVELNSALYMGGLTPSLGSLVLTKKNTDLKVIAMVRPRGAGFCYTEEEFACMLEDSKLLLEHGADGLAFGCLDKEGNVNVEQTNEMIHMIRSFEKEVVFHRAFDCTKDPYASMEILVELGVDRVLSSGTKEKAMEGKALLKELQLRFGERIELLAGSGMNASNAKELMEYTGIQQVHSSCKGWLTDMTTMIGEVHYAYLTGNHQQDYDVVKEELVRALIESVVD